ncbi:MAG: hypothetical protein AB7V32_06690 [Candidatus Berkiella sp.]
MIKGIQSEQQIADIINQYHKTELEKFNAILQAKIDENYTLESTLMFALTQDEQRRFTMYCSDLKLINQYQATHPTFNQRNLYTRLYDKHKATGLAKTANDALALEGKSNAAKRRSGTGIN